MVNEKIRLAMTKVLMLTAAGSIMLSAHAAPAKQAPDQEKCYGIVKAGMNDCQTANGSCAGSSVKDSQGDAFIFLPKGLCKRIVGGGLTKK